MAFEHPSIIVVSGPMGAGKSTLATMLASRSTRTAVVNGGDVQRLIASGLSWPHSQAEADASGGAFEHQLRVRLRGACALAHAFVASGYTAIIEEQIVGERVEHLLAELPGTRFSFIQLAPRFEVVAARERERGTDNFERWGSWDELLATGTTKIGLWLDTSDQTPEETLAEILDRAEETLVEERDARPTPDELES